MEHTSNIIQEGEPCPLLSIRKLSIRQNQQMVRLRGRVFSKKDCGRVLFLILRDGLDTLQTIALKNPDNLTMTLGEEEYKVLRKVENESFIEVIGKVSLKQVAACSQKQIELEIISYTILSKSTVDLPITLKEMERIDAHKKNDFSLPSVPLSKRLDHRVLDLRANVSQAIFRINDGMLFAAQTFLRKHHFLEIKTPKLIGCASEGGASVFHVDYFGKPACLAQSPQLYKQMAIIADFKRVFEIGPVFRAELSDTNRHLTEFTGIDIEMTIDRSYMEVVELLYSMLYYVLDYIIIYYDAEIKLIHSYIEVPHLLLPKELVALTFQEALELLRSSGNKVNDFEDLTTVNEKKLGALIRDRYKTDLYVITEYPANVRPFYTMPKADDSRYTYSYDFMLRGSEILSGAQRIHDHAILMERMITLGIDPASISHYLTSFQYGAPLHGGAGLGAERILKNFLGLPDVRYCSLFPHDPKRLHP